VTRHDPSNCLIWGVHTVTDRPTKIFGRHFLTPPVKHQTSLIYFFLSPPEGGLDLVTNRQGRVPSNRSLQNPLGRTGSLARSSYNSRKRPLRRSCYEHGGVGFGPVGRSGLVPRYRYQISVVQSYSQSSVQVLITMYYRKPATNLSDW